MLTKIFLGLISSEVFLNSLLAVAGLTAWAVWRTFTLLFTFVPPAGLEPT